MANAVRWYGDIMAMRQDCPMFFLTKAYYDRAHPAGPVTAPVFRNPTSEAGT